jgi:hypothetical protein
MDEVRLNRTGSKPCSSARLRNNATSVGRQSLSLSIPAPDLSPVVAVTERDVPDAPGLGNQFGGPFPFFRNFDIATRRPRRTALSRGEGEDRTAQPNVTAESHH